MKRSQEIPHEWISPPIPARGRRLTEERAGSAKSVFHFDVPSPRSIRRCGSRGFARQDRTGDQHDAGIAAWLSRADRDGSLAAFLKPDLTPPERAVAQVEGWILGVPGLIRAGGERNDPASTACNSTMSSLH